MNVIGSRPDRWWNDPKRAMRDMALTLDGLAASTGDEVTVVFDTDPGPIEDVPNLTVVIARRRGRNAADHEIEQLVAGDDDPTSLRVVTSDRRLIEKVAELGAKVTSSGRFRTQLEK